MMKRILTLCVLVLAVAISVQAQSRKERKILFGSSYNYEVTTEGVGQDGTKLIKVWGYGKKAEDAIVQAKKNAVAACLFRGLPGGNGANQAMGTPPICKDPNAEEKNLDYFYNFFETGSTYLKFINLTTDGIPSGQDRRKIKGGYKVALYVQVMHDNLRKQMENDGIVRSLSSGF